MSEGKHSFMDEISEVATKAVDGIKHFGSNVADASKDFVSSTKLSGERKDLRKEIDDAYLQLGKLAYQQGGLTGEMAKISDHIHELYNKLQDVALKINES